MVVSVRVVAGNAASAEDGENLLREILPALSRQEFVTVSFAGLSAVPSSFVNAGLLPLLDHFHMSYIRQHLGFEGTSGAIASLIRRRFEERDAELLASRAKEQ